ncbi:MAG: aldehyde ferredoxin oxidoreductase [Anaerolineales bacterium]|nr:MAG: aldehyde ferredoxin oxidoreductase [Anaerolineales bacterium]
MLEGGYLGEVLRVNLSTREHRVEQLKENDVVKLLGARGLAAKAYYDEIGPQVRPFDPANKAILMTGPLTGVKLPSTTKIGFSTKSPETGIYLCANAGGDFGPQLKFSGFDGLIIEGQADEWTYLLIRDGEVSFGDARPWQGLTTSETLEALKEAIGDERAAALSIGPAAERLVRLSYVNVDTRAIGRGGAGAVLGSKRLKGVAVLGSGSIPVAHPARVKEIRRAAIKELRETRANHTRYGTPQYIEIINELGCMPTRNFQTTYFEGADKIDAHVMRDEYWARNSGCYQCPVACGKVCEVNKGPFAGARARTEFETIALLGPNCGVDDYGAIIAANELCDEIGIDTMSAGNAVALTMELYERGLIGSEDTEGIEARFGNAQALVDLIRLIGERRGIGDLLAEGMARVAAARPEWNRYILAVKGLPLAGYDPRGFYGNGLTYGTSSRGACHNVGGWTIRAELQSGQYDRFALKGKGALVQTIQDNRAYVDSLGLCTVVRGSMGFADAPRGNVLEAVTGYDFTPRLMEIGARIYNLERLILNREGIRRKDALLPERITKERVPSGPTKGRILTDEMYAVMLDEYYQARGWDEDGVPAPETIRRLGLDGLLSSD